MLNVENASKVLSLEDFLLNPLDHVEWVDGQLVEKTGMTLRMAWCSLDWILLGEFTNNLAVKEERFLRYASISQSAW